MIEFVKEYRKLSENRLAYLNIGYLKPEKFKEYKKKVKFYKKIVNLNYFICFLERRRSDFYSDSRPNFFIFRLENHLEIFRRKSFEKQRIKSSFIG